MLNTEKIKELLAKHIEKGCKYKNTEKGCLCQQSLDADNPLTLNTACHWDVKEAALAEPVPDPDVILGVAIAQLEKQGWQFTFKPKYKKGVGILHTGKPPIGHAHVSQVVLGQANGALFALAMDQTGWMIGKRPETFLTVDDLHEALMDLVNEAHSISAHDVPHDIELSVGEIMSSDDEPEEDTVDATSL